MVEVHLWGALRPAVGGAPSVSVEAKNIRELFKKLGEDYPGFQNMKTVGDDYTLRLTVTVH